MSKEVEYIKAFVGGYFGSSICFEADLNKQIISCEVNMGATHQGVRIL